MIVFSNLVVDVLSRHSFGFLHTHQTVFSLHCHTLVFGCCLIVKHQLPNLQISLSTTTTTHTLTNTETMSNGTKSSSQYGERVHVSKHPIVAHKTSILRSSTTTPSVFRAVLRELTYHLGYEATSTLTTVPIDISVPVPTQSGELDHFECKGDKLKERVCLVPILRSGLGMVDAMLELLPNAAIHHIGMYKAPGQSHPVQYFQRLPRQCKADVAYILDACIATSSTIKSVITLLKKVRCIRRIEHKILCIMPISD